MADERFNQYEVDKALALARMGRRGRKFETLERDYTPAQVRAMGLDPAAILAQRKGAIPPDASPSKADTRPSPEPDTPAVEDTPKPMFSPEQFDYIERYLYMGAVDLWLRLVSTRKRELDSDWDAESLVRFAVRKRMRLKPEALEWARAMGLYGPGLPPIPKTAAAPTPHKRRKRGRPRRIDPTQDNSILRAYAGGTLPKDIPGLLRSVAKKDVDAAIARGKAKYRRHLAVYGNAYTLDGFKKWCATRTKHNLVKPM